MNVLFNVNVPYKLSSNYIYLQTNTTGELFRFVFQLFFKRGQHAIAQLQITPGVYLQKKGHRLTVCVYVCVVSYVVM